MGNCFSYQEKNNENNDLDIIDEFQIIRKYDGSIIPLNTKKINKLLKINNNKQLLQECSNNRIIYLFDVPNIIHYKKEINKCISYGADIKLLNICADNWMNKYWYIACNNKKYKNYCEKYTTHIKSKNKICIDRLVYLFCQDYYDGLEKEIDDCLLFTTDKYILINLVNNRLRKILKKQNYTNLILDINMCKKYGEFINTKKK